MYPARPYVEDHHHFNKVTQQSRAVDSFTVFVPTTAGVDTKL